MAVEKKVETLEGELKLMKGELKETLTSVRDFLLNLKMPPPQIEGLEGDETSKVNIGGMLATAVGSAAQVPVQQVPVQVERPVEMAQASPAVRMVEAGQPGVAPAAEVSAPPQILKAETTPGMGTVAGGISAPEDETQPQRQSAETETPAQPATPEPRGGGKEPQCQIEEEKSLDELPGQHRDGERHEPVAEQESPQATSSTSRINLLGNLMRWVSVAVWEIGNEQLPAFLDIYSITGDLSPETREVILRFADVVAHQPGYANGDGVWGQIMTEQFSTFLDVQTVNGKLSPDVKEGILRFVSSMLAHPSDRSVADIWGRLSLELHGILSGGGWFSPVSAMSRNVEEPAVEAEVDEDGTEESPDMEVDETVGQEEKTVTLKLVFPTSAGGDKEFNVDNFSINVNPEMGTGHSGEKSVKTKRAKRKKS